MKSGKRLIMDNVGPGGSLKTDKIARALLQHRNCPDPDTGLSPSQIVLGRVLRDHISFTPGFYSVHPHWRMQSNDREKALAKRHILKQEQLGPGKKLENLAIGDCVWVQDQAAAKQPGKWTKTGVVTEVLGHDAFMVRIDGSRRVTKRNRKFLRKIVPFTEAIKSRFDTLLQPVSNAPLGGQVLPESVDHQPPPLRLKLYKKDDIWQAQISEQSEN